MILRLVQIGTRNLARNARRTAITVLALGGGLGLAIVTWVLVDGYTKAAIDAMVGGTYGHLQVQDPGQLLAPNIFDAVEDADAVVAALTADPRVLAATARVHTPALLAVGDISSGADVWGLDPEREGGVSRWPHDVVEGRFVQAPGEVVLGLGLARRLEASLGSEVVCLTGAADGSLGSALWTVVGVADLHSDTANRGTAWITLAASEDLLALRGAHTVVARVSDPEAAVAVTRDFAVRSDWTGVLSEGPTEGAELPPQPNKVAVDPLATHVVRSWKALNPFMAEMYALTGTWTLVSVAIVLITAGMGAMNTLLMSVAERTRELGILIAIGLRPRQMVALVVFESLALWAVSVVGGVALGGAMSWYLVAWGLDFSDSSGDIVFAGVAMEPVLHGAVSLEAFVVPCAGLFVVAVLASLLPALRAARLDPAVAMHQS
ncbi:MAG: ABC transporter permease [Alphaproteobacteria bacterium]|nr:ABC transporter permease [Alphaproteobacteria bacterium]